MVVPVINVATLTATLVRRDTRAAVVVQATNRPELPAKPANVVQLQEPAISARKALEDHVLYKTVALSIHLKDVLHLQVV